MFIQGLFLIALALATGAIAFINDLIKSGPFTSRTSREDSALLEFSDQVRYFTENSRDNCRNSLIFKKMTGRHAPIRLINLIFSCYDPHLRSEEHTSELQSPVPNSYAVFCLKKKKTKNAIFCLIVLTIQPSLYNLSYI